MSIRVGYIAGKDFTKNLRQWGIVAENRPHLVQMFVMPRLLNNNVIKVQWSPTSIQMTKISNKTSIIE